MYTMQLTPFDKEYVCDAYNAFAATRMRDVMATHNT